MQVSTIEGALIYEAKSPYQTIKLYKSQPESYWLALNDMIQFHTESVYSIAEYGVKKAIQLCKTPPKKCLILGGGTGFAANEALKCPSLEKIINIEIDPLVLKLSKNSIISKLNNNSLNNSRIELIQGDAIEFLNNSSENFDVIIDDCEYEVGSQPSSQIKYDLYCQNLVKKLTPGGIASVTEPLERYKPIRVASHIFLLKKNPTKFGISPSGEILLSLDSDIRNRWLLRNAKKTIKSWDQVYVAYCVQATRLLGPECYLYFSNQPMKRLSGVNYYEEM
jgi:hypothetical protein